jgi:hypothetical protein
MLRRNKYADAALLLRDLHPMPVSEGVESRRTSWRSILTNLASSLLHQGHYD